MPQQEMISAPPISSQLQCRIGACAKRPIIHLARICIELKSPMHIGSGAGDGDSDAGIVFDANGLAAIPGSSIKGVLRHAYEAYRASPHAGENYPDLPAASDVFGSPLIAEENDFTPKQGGRIMITWAHVHDQSNRPVDQPLASGDVTADDVLKLASSPELRDHVCIDHRGTAVARGKFDELIAAPGLRFTFGLEMRSGVDEDGEVLLADQDAWDVLLMILTDPLLRFGGKGRRGFGSFELISQDHRIFRLDGLSTLPDRWDELEERDTDVEWKLFISMPVSLGDPFPSGLESGFHDKENWLDGTEKAKLPTRHLTTYQCCLAPEHDTFWMFGGGKDSEASDSTPVRLQRVIWNDASGQGSVRTSYLIPGSSIKGALRHRMAFHYRRLTGAWNDGATPLTSDLPQALQDLFGFVSEGGKAASGITAPRDVAKPGKLYIDDLFVDQEPRGVVTASIQNHVAIDRVLGGAMDHLLYDDLPLTGGNFKFLVHLENPETIDSEVKQALMLALEDACNGRLALGAHAGRGYGYFSGKAELLPDPTLEEAPSIDE